MFKKLKDKYNNYLGRYRIYKVLRDRYPHYKKFYPTLEKAMGDWDKARNYLIELEERGYVQERDDEGVGFTDDIYYKLTAKGKDKLSLGRKIRNIILYIVISVLIIVIASYFKK